MADNSVVQTIKDAEIDARSLSEFISKDASFIVSRRLAPSVHTLDYYIDKVNNIASQIGFVIKGSFSTGATLSSPIDVVQASDGKLYRWGGNLPKVVPASSTPANSGGMGTNAWLEVSDVALRLDLANPVKGATMVGYGDGSVADKLDEIVSGAVTEPLVDAKVDTHNHNADAHPELRTSIVSEATSHATDEANRAQSEADRAETARDAAFVNADVYPDVATGRAAVAVGEQFQVLSTDGFEYIRYRKDSASTQTEVARFPSKAGIYIPKRITDTHLDDLMLAGDYAARGGDATEENGYPLTRSDCFISVEVAGVHGRIQTVKDRMGNIATRVFRVTAFNPRWSPWEKMVKSSEVQINRGVLDGVELRSIMQVGTYYVKNATDFPPDFGRTEGFLRVTQFNSRFERELIDQWDYSNRYVQVGNFGEWEKAGSPKSLNTGDLPVGEVKLDPFRKDDIFYNSFGSVSARQKSYSDMYEMTNAQVANGDMLATVYGFFDQLVVDFPDYVSMQVLGTENTGLEIREYVILPRKINKMASSPASINRFPELLLFAGQHGQEYTAIINLMIFCDEMMRNYNSRDIYGTLRTSAVLRIMPAMNPWGVKNAKRRNSNNIDLNRNFPDGWENATGDKGNSPLSEIESVTLSNWVESNKENAICTLNMHDHSDRALTWGTATASWTEKLLFRSFQRVGKWYHANFDDTSPEDPVSWLGNPRDGYADKYIYNTLGVPALMFECPYINHPKLGPKISSVRFASRQILTEIMEMIMGRYFRELD